MSIYSFTSSDEIDTWTPQQRIIELTGYVDQIINMKPTKAGGNIFKFVVNNNDGKRIRVVMFGKVAEKYDTIINKNMVVKISKAQLKNADMNYWKSYHGVLKIEIIPNESSLIEILDKITKNEANENIQKTTIQECLNFNGDIIVEGYIKVNFYRVTISNSSFGLGSITDSFYKLEIHIVNFKEIDDLKTGSHIHVKGFITYDEGYPLLRVLEMSNIIIIDNKLMNNDKLKTGFRIPIKNVSNTPSTSSLSNENIEDNNNSKNQDDTLSDENEFIINNKEPNNNDEENSEKYDDEENLHKKTKKRGKYDKSSNNIKKSKKD